MSEQVVPTFFPRVAGPYWSTIGEFVTDAVREAAAESVYNERDLFAAVTPLVLWAWQSQGWPLERDVIFTVEAIESFVGMGLQHYRSNAGRNTLRSATRCTCSTCETTGAVSIPIPSITR